MTPEEKAAYRRQVRDRFEDYIQNKRTERIIDICKKVDLSQTHTRLFRSSPETSQMSLPALRRIEQFLDNQGKE